ALAWLANEAGAGVGDALAPIDGRAAVSDGDHPVVAHAVLGGHELAPLLKPGRQPGLFVPEAEIARLLNAGDGQRLFADAINGIAAAGEQSGGGGGKESVTHNR